MATLINGNGNLAIYAQQDADWYAALMGGQTVITAVGNQFAYELLDANTIGVKDGVIITTEGRRIQLDANAIDSFDIPTGAQGTTNYYIIGYHLVTGDLSEQTCETFVQLMENGTDTIPEGSFRDGDDEVFVSLYRVEQNDLTLGTITLLLPQLSGSFQSQITELNNDLTDAVTELREEIESMGTVLIGSYNTVKSINISEFNDTNASHYLAVQIADGEQSSRTYSDPNGSWQSYGYAYAYKPTITISGNTLTFTPARVRAKSQYDNSSYMMTSLYYVGKISQ